MFLLDIKEEDFYWYDMKTSNACLYLTNDSDIANTFLHYILLITILQIIDKGLKCAL